MNLTTTKGLQWLLCCAALTIGMVTSAQGQSWTLNTLFDALANNPQMHSRFVEQKTIAEFDAPIESTGELIFSAPARLVKRTLSPDAETLTLDNQTLIVERDGFRREIAAADMPAVGAFVSSLRGFVSGELKSVQVAFELNLSGNKKQWEITGKPRDVSVKKIVRAIEVTGSADRIRVFTVELMSGDVSTITIIQ